MASRTKDGAPGKEKRRLSTTGPRLASSSSSKSLTSTDKNPVSPSSEKPIPNYLKATRTTRVVVEPSKRPPSSSSSSSDASSRLSVSRRQSIDKAASPTQIPKTARVSLIPKPALDRRKSFDSRPPPPRQVTKARVLTQSASSSAIRSGMVGSQKGLQDLLNSPKGPGEKKSLYRRPVSLLKSSSGKSRDNEKLKAPAQAPAPEPDQPVTSYEDHIPDIANIPEPEPLVSDEEITIYSLNDNEMLTDIVEEENQEPVDIPNQPELKFQEDSSIKTAESESSAVPDEPSDETSAVADEPSDVKEIEKSEIVDETSNTVLESEQEPANESLDNESKPEERNEAADEKETEEVKEAVEEVKEVEKIVAPKRELPVKAKWQTMEVKDGPEDIKNMAKIVLPKRDLPVKTKPESAVSNNVIEETASKLQEQRKNRVRALAGAFETVISLQEPK